MLEVKSFILDGKDYTNNVKSITFIDTSDFYQYTITLNTYILTPTSPNPSYSLTINDTTITENDGFNYELFTPSDSTTSVRFRKSKQ